MLGLASILLSPRGNGRGPGTSEGYRSAKRPRLHDPDIEAGQRLRHGQRKSGERLRVVGLSENVALTQRSGNGRADSSLH